MQQYPPEVDLSNCDKEPIHIPGSIQPHGLLLVLDPASLQIQQISANCADWLGQPATAWLNQPLQALFAEQEISALRHALAADPLQHNPTYLWTVPLGTPPTPFDASVHLSNGMLLLELEPARLPSSAPKDFYRLVKGCIQRIQQAPTFDDFCQIAAAEVQMLTGYDRVMVYRFDADGHGSVIAEARAPALQPFLGLHYPASDIPKQARALYLLNWLRMIVDVDYAPAPIVPPLNPASQAPVDLSYAALRSVSPIHVEYLQNMGVHASMSISLVHNGELWGLIACHHMQPRYLTYEVRNACEFLAQAVSLQLDVKQNAADYAYHAQLQTASQRLIAAMAQAPVWHIGLREHAELVLNFVEASGAAICTSDGIALYGQTPPESAVAQLIDWLQQQEDVEVLATDQLAALLPEWAEHSAVASGILALPIVRELGEYLIWFRPEEVQTVNWSGAPTKAVTLTDDGLRLSPRKSFELWKETVRGHSQDWLPLELETVAELRTAVAGVILQRTEELARLNTQLQRTNLELDAFAYIVSHDLKEPLRGIHNYAAFLVEDYSAQLDADGSAKLATLVRLSQRMETLINSLLYYSRVGHSEFHVVPVDVNTLLAEALDVLQVQIEQAGVELRVPAPLPVVSGDRERLGEVLSNLISNALKYRHASAPWIEIGALAAEQAPQALERDFCVLYVRDNGIGIDQRHHETIFRIFKRLHARNAQGGGTGVGLTIVKRIIERHGGTIWLESQPEQGTTFFFTLPTAQAVDEHA